MKNKPRKIRITEAQLKRIKGEGYDTKNVKFLNESVDNLIHPDLNDGSGSVQDSAEDIARILKKDGSYEPYLSKGQSKLDLVELLISQLNFKWQDFKEEYKNKGA